MSALERVMTFPYSLYLCAGFGGLIAAIADVVQKEEASAVVKLTSVSARQMRIELQPVWVLFVIVLFALFLCYVFQPRERRAAFAVGAGVIAFIMTVTPYKRPESGVVAESSSYLLTAPVRVAGNAEMLPIAMGAGLLKNQALIRVFNDLPAPVEIKISLFDKTTSNVLEQRKTVLPEAEGEFAFYVGTNEEHIRAEFYVGLASQQSSYFTIDTAGGYMSPKLLVSNLFPDYASVNLNKNLAEKWNQDVNNNPLLAERSITDRELNALYGRENNFIGNIGQKLFRQYKW